MNDKQALEFARLLADGARVIALEHFRTILDVGRKVDGSPVTIADKKIESALRQMIREKYPQHGVAGEEYGGAPGADYTWVLDPIDGTKGFVMGNPLFGTLIGLLRGDAPFIGLVDIPAMGERWAGNGKCTTFDDGTQICVAAVSGCQSINRASLYIASLDLRDSGTRHALDALSEQVAVARPACDCYAYGLLALGHCDLVVEVDLEPYDYLPLVPVVESAGGWMTDWSGNPLTLNSSGRVIAAASKSLLDATIRAIDS